ncbi:hypothetical protein M6B38_262830 [Iris pallida]|uniref:Uncharacterized protein n=1 Tax=Iris pallida TaxID=29817 RepID=A0AAX6FHS0_IRIPA|nr:hypothetical protein M6B38_418330 [Iris pallida]KAJ6851034.1 hypothetical protein M6B38_262830 [Iris pallida]
MSKVGGPKDRPDTKLTESVATRMEMHATKDRVEFDTSTVDSLRSLCTSPLSLHEMNLGLVNGSWP